MLKVEIMEEHQAVGSASFSTCSHAVSKAVVSSPAPREQLSCLNAKIHLIRVISSKKESFDWKTSWVLALEEQGWRPLLLPPHVSES